MQETIKLFMDVLKANVEKLQWTRTEQELSSSFGNYNMSFRLNNNNCFLKVTPKGTQVGYTICSIEYPEVVDLYNFIKEFYNTNKQLAFWTKVTNELSQTVMYLNKQH